MDAIEATDLYRFYHSGDMEIFALRGVSLKLRAGEFKAVTGPSGSGKSTLLACLAGLDDPDGGQVQIMGQRMSRRAETERAALRARHLGILMQSGNLFDHLTLEDNLRMRLELAGTDEGDGPESLLERMGLERRRQAYPSQLSGGETARGSLAAVLCSNPAVLLADEPTAEMDLETAKLVMDLLTERCRAGMAMLLVTHSHGLAAMADDILRLDDGRLCHE